MMRCCCLLFLGAIMTAEAADRDLTAMMKPEKQEFRTDEQVRFTVTFTNHSKDVIVLPVQDFLGSQTVGASSPSICNVTTGEQWQVLPQRYGAPVRMTQQSIEAGKTLALAYSLPGPFAKANGVPVPRLPAGKYELELTIETNGLTLKPKGAFTLVDRSQLTKEETAMIVTQAREALATKLARQAAAEKGQQHPGAVDWAKVKPDAFVATFEQVQGGTAVTFSGDVPGSDRVVVWSVVVTDKGVSPSAMTQGFVIRSNTSAATVTSSTSRLGNRSER